MRAKFAVLSMLLVLGLATLTVGYAYWTETLTISGSVTTGNLSVAFDNPTTSDSDVDLAGGGTCTAVIEGAATDAETLKVTLGNAYPGYSCEVAFNVKNDGSIPVNLNSISLGTIPSALTVTTVDDVIVSNLAVGAQEAGKLKVEVISGLTGDENTTFTFTGSILAVQFNQP